MKTRIVGCDVALKARQYGLTLFTLSLFHAFAGNAQSVVGRWIGIHTEWDLNTYCPLPAYMDFNADSTWQLGLIDESVAPRTSQWTRLPNDSLRFNGATYAPDLIVFNGDQLKIGRAIPMLFRRYQAVPIKRETVWERLAGQVWQSDSVQYRFATDGRVTLYHRRTGTQTVHFAEVLALGESAFLLVRGNQNGREGDIRAFWQVVSNEVGVIRLQGGFGKNIGTETLRWVRALNSNDSFRATTFQPCTNCAAQDQMIVFGGLNDLNKRKVLTVIQHRYQPVDAPDQSGVITLKFVRNCAGGLGPIEFQQLNSDYKRRPFDKRITDQLVDIVRNHIPGSLYGDDRSRSRDQTLAFTIRLVEGRITDLF